MSSCKPDTIVIDGARYIKSGTSQKGPLSLVILDRGFIYVGELAYGGTGLINASNVRKWSLGGIGGLTRGAKSSKAVLDKCEDVIWPPKSEIAIHGLQEDWEDA